MPQHEFNGVQADGNARLHAGDVINTHHHMNQALNYFSSLGQVERDALLCKACISGQSRRVKLLLDASANFDCKDAQGFTPLQHCIKHARFDCVSLLLSCGADANDDAGYPTRHPLWLVTNSRAKNKSAVIIELLKENADPKVLLGEMTLLMAAVLDGDRDTAKALVEHGVNVNEDLGTKSKHPLWLIMNSDMEGKSHIMNDLLNERANPNVLSDDGKTLLAVAIEKGDAEVAEILLVHGGHLQTPGEVNNMTPLSHAIKMGKIDIVMAILEVVGMEATAEERPLTCVGLCDKKHLTSLTALGMAIAMKESMLVSELLARGASFLSAEEGDLPPLMVAVYHENMDAINKLLVHARVYDKMGATNNYGFSTTLDLNMRAASMHNLSALHIAVLKGNCEIANMLLDEGADVDFPARGMTPLAYAVENDKTSMAELLLMRSANVQAIIRLNSQHESHPNFRWIRNLEPDVIAGFLTLAQVAVLKDNALMVHILAAYGGVSKPPQSPRTFTSAAEYL